jgi:hypothetical protein
MTRRTALKATGGSAAAAPAIPRGAARPNILFLMTDDQRYNAMSCAGNRILSTPHMDRIASGGVRSENAFVTNSLCSPSRCHLPFAVAAGGLLHGAIREMAQRSNLYGKPEYSSRAEELKARLERMRSDLGDDRSEDGTATAPCTIRIANLPYR